MFKRVGNGLLAVCLLVSGFTGCAKKQAQVEDGQVPVRVAFWGGVEEKEIITTTVRDWEKNNPGVKVVLEHIPQQYTDKVLTEIAGGNPPDIIFCEVSVFITFFYKNALLDLTPYLERDKDFDITRFFPQVVDRFTREGKIFCIPRDTAPFGTIFYNKSLFKKYNVPFPTEDWDTDRFLELAKMITRDVNGKAPHEAGFNPKKIDIFGFQGWAWDNFLYTFGGKFVDNVSYPTKCLIDEPQAIEGLKFFVNLSKKHHVSPLPDALKNMGMNTNQLFSMNRLAMFQSGIWETPNLRRTVADKFEWDVVMFPKGPKGTRGFGTGGSGYAIMRTTRFPDEAWEVVKCLAGNVGQEMLADTGLAQPASKEIAEGPHWAKCTKPPLNKGMLNRAVEHTVYLPFHLSWREAWDKYANPKIDLILNGSLDPEKGLKEVAKKINKVLQESK